MSLFPSLHTQVNYDSNEYLVVYERYRYNINSNLASLESLNMFLFHMFSEKKLG